MRDGGERLYDTDWWIRCVNTGLMILPNKQTLLYTTLDYQIDQRIIPFSEANSFQHPDSCCGLTFKTLADVISVGSSSVLKQHLSGLTGPGQ